MTQTVNPDLFRLKNYNIMNNPHTNFLDSLNQFYLFKRNVFFFIKIYKKFNFFFFNFNIQRCYLTKFKIYFFGFSLKRYKKYIHLQFKSIFKKNNLKKRTLYFFFKKSFIFGSLNTSSFLFSKKIYFSLFFFFKFLKNKNVFFKFFFRIKMLTFFLRKILKKKKVSFFLEKFVQVNLIFINLFLFKKLTTEKFQINKSYFIIFYYDLVKSFSFHKIHNCKFIFLKNSISKNMFKFFFFRNLIFSFFFYFYINLSYSMDYSFSLFLRKLSFLKKTRTLFSLKKKLNSVNWINKHFFFRFLKKKKMIMSSLHQKFFLKKIKIKYKKDIKQFNKNNIFNRTYIKNIINFIFKRRIWKKKKLKKNKLKKIELKHK